MLDSARKKITRMGTTWRDSLGLGYIKIILSCLIRRKQEATIFVCATKFRNGCVVAWYIKESLVQRAA
jgi:hypothetical protein